MPASLLTGDPHSEVAYGLGNFVFYARQLPGIDTGVLLVTVDGDEVIDHEWRPARLRDGIPPVLEAEEAQDAVAAWRDLRDCTQLRAD